MTIDDLPPVTRPQLAAALRQAGPRPGGVLVVHTRMSAIGWVVGGADTVVLALEDAIGEAGTMLVYTCWEHDAFHIDACPEARRRAYLAEPPVFDPETSPGWSGVGRIPGAHPHGRWARRRRGARPRHLGRGVRRRTPHPARR